MSKMILGMAALVLSSSLAGQINVSRAADVAAPTPPATAPATAPEAAAEKFYGSVSAVDLKAMTFTIGEQTFTVTATTPMTKIDGSTATLADAVVGEPARGTFTKGSDGKLVANKVRFGKKAGGGAGGKAGGKKKDAAATQQ